MTADVLREKFLDFFKAKEHKIVDSDSLVPKEDPTVLFTPAGMNQFKKEFMGFDSGFKRAATAQRCLRTDDLDKVGKTNCHHTFFEMLGNFSFGDYFKKEAISWAWEFLIKELKIGPERLRVSVYQDDDQAYNIWKDTVGMPPERIVRLGDKDNFWPAEAKAKGPNGPCGPCSEIFYDFGPDIGCGGKICDPSCSCGRFVEIWNLVFTQFNRKDGGSLEPLPNKNIDTGMGLERLTAVMQGKQNNFETELFQPIIKEIIRRQSPSQTACEKKLLYAIADHIRAVVFSIFDGIMPSNEGRGYVVRKIIRKSVLHLRSLGIIEPFLYRLVSIEAEIMRKPYPELINQREEIAQIVLAEEKNFIYVLSSSGELFKNKFTEFKEKPNPEAVGSAAFLLHDTYGIPLELTKEWLDKQKIDFSQQAFEIAMEEQKSRSKIGSAMQGDVFGAPKLAVAGLPKTQFLGYDQLETKAKVIKVIMDLDHPDRMGVILDKTVFYAESGGQVGDIGVLSIGANVFSVIDVQKSDDVFVHWGKFANFPNNGDIVDAKIDAIYRMNIARNHTATHILQAALRKVLGNHVQQQGSLVGPEKLRFDFTHFKKLSKEEILRVEEVANAYILNEYSVGCKEMPLKEAKKSGALAFFEEKYAESVRVVSVGGISNELCGGTHITDARQIGLIKITSEGSVASGVRRIEAVTARFAEQFIEEQAKRDAQESERKNKLQEEKDRQKKRSAEMSGIVLKRVPLLIENAAKLNGVNTIFSVEENLDISALRQLADMIKDKLSQAVIVLGARNESENKVFLVVSVSQTLLSKGMDAGELIRQVSGFIGGSGGGRKDFAQAGGSKIENLTLAIDKLRDIINKLL